MGRRAVLASILTAALLIPAFIPTSAQQAESSADSIRQNQILQNYPRIQAHFMPDSIGIADVFDLVVEVDKDVMQLVGFPEFKDGMLGEIIEIVSESEIDTVKVDGRRVTLAKTYKLQGFEEGYFGLGRFPMLYVDKNITDTIWSVDSMKIKVGTFQIDTTTQTIYDIKPPLEAPLKIGEISGYILWSLLALAVIGALLWYIYTRRRNLSIMGKPKPVDPPHVAAIKALEALHHQKLWQNNKHKLYYTRMTDILREYIGARYVIHAMEMTSDEIRAALRVHDLPKKSFENLEQILSTADLVKFAKYVPEGDVNEKLYNDAYYFVEETKPELIETPEQQQ